MNRIPWRLLFALAMLPVCLAAAPVRAEMIGVNFSGTLGDSYGNPPGNPTSGSIFYGSLVYDTSQTPDAGSNALFASYSFTGASARLTIIIADETLGTVPNFAEISFFLQNDFLINEDTGEPTNFLDPDHVLQDIFQVSSVSNAAAGPGPYDVSIVAVDQTMTMPEAPSNLLESTMLPVAVGDLTDILTDASVEIRWFDDDNTVIYGTIASVYPIPEPATGSLVLLGFGIVAGARRATRR